MKKYTNAEESFLIDNYPSKGILFCSESLNVPIASLKSKVIYMRLRLNREVRGKIIRESKKKKLNSMYSVNPENFFEPKTPEVAYILGLLWADGYVLKRRSSNSVSLSVQEEDFLYFEPVLKKTGRWNIRYYQHKNRKPQGLAEISNRPLVDFLIEHDYRTKSFESACKILSIIPDNLKHYWFRGLFDGDGCIYFNPSGLHIKISICSSYEQNWKYIENLFKLVLNDDRFFIRRKIRKNGNKHSKIEVIKRSTILKFLNYIYNGYEIDKIGLPRKYEKYLKVVDRERKCSEKRKIISPHIPNSGIIQ